jgi:hypothetical protein
VLGGGELDRESSRGGVEYLPWGSRPPWNRIGAEEDGACYWGVASCKKKGDRPGEDGGQVRLLKELHSKAGMAGFGAKKLWASRGWANWIWPAAGLRGGELSAPRNGGEGSACAMAKLQAGRRKKTGSDAMDGGEGRCAGRADRGEWARSPGFHGRAGAEGGRWPERSSEPMPRRRSRSWRREQGRAPTMGTSCSAPERRRGQVTGETAGEGVWRHGRGRRSPACCRVGEGEAPRERWLGEKGRVAAG